MLGQLLLLNWKRMMSHRFEVLVAFCWVYLLLPVNWAAAQQGETNAVSVDQADEDSVRAHLKRYTQAFNDRRWEDLGQLVASDVTYRDESSAEQISGVHGLIGRIKTAVEREPGLVLKAQIIGLENQNQGDVDVAKMVVRGQTTLVSESMPDEVSDFVVTVVKQSGHWTITSIVEQAPIDAERLSLGGSPEPNHAIESLEWLVGTWEDSSDRRLQSEIEYLPGRKFLRRTILDPSTKASIGYELVGYDAKSNLVRSWMFFTDGSFGSGIWSSGSDHWRLKLVQTLRDGRSALGTYIIRPEDKNTMVVQMISREIDGEPMPSGQEVTLKRIDGSVGVSSESTPAIGAE
ncbi:hypothetical protein LOC67_00820 [Stieleria sp. JC731]|uniref:hypothetical protein n=1 Tax=Pirellulaceae TaxID=2691357 RepID=UPI001E5F37EF|nr:hypothetical protein [Stieleria sp. JC731]MCC9599084.1 hypothetical protein [Stieleria sp. JC731]